MRCSLLEFTLHSPFDATGDQPQAIEKLAQGLDLGFEEQRPQGMQELRIVDAALGNNAPLYGAAEYALDRLG